MGNLKSLALGAFACFSNNFATEVCGSFVLWNNSSLNYSWIGKYVGEFDKKLTLLDSSIFIRPRTAIFGSAASPIRFKFVLTDFLSFHTCSKIFLQQICRLVHYLFQNSSIRNYYGFDFFELRMCKQQHCNIENEIQNVTFTTIDELA